MLQIVLDLGSIFNPTTEKETKYICNYISDAFEGQIICLFDCL